MKVMTGLLEEWGKKIVLARTINVCCSEEIMLQAVRIHLSPVRSKCDALVMLSCAGGIKTAFLCNPGIPVVAALDSIGSGMVTRQNNPVALSQCVTCGHCVLTFTGGICPISECPFKKNMVHAKKHKSRKTSVRSQKIVCVYGRKFQKEVLWRY